MAQFRYMMDSKYDSKSHIEKNSNTKFAHVVVEASRKFQKNVDCLMGRRQHVGKMRPLQCTRR